MIISICISMFFEYLFFPHALKGRKSAWIAHLLAFPSEESLDCCLNEIQFTEEILWCC